MCLFPNSVCACVQRVLPPSTKIRSVEAEKKARKRLALCDVTNVYDEFSKDLSACPEFNHSRIEEYLPNCAVRRKSYLFFIEGYVNKVLFCPLKTADPNTCCFKARCLPSLKKGSYQVQVDINRTDGRIVSAVCGCPAGLAGDCHHIGALLYVIADMKIRGLDVIPDDQTCTELPCAWINPKAGQKSGLPISELKIVKVNKVPLVEHLSDPLKRKLKKRCYDPRHPKDREVNLQNIEHLYDGLQRVLPNCAFVRYFEQTPLCVQEDTQVAGPSGCQEPFEPNSIERLSAASIYSDFFQEEVRKYIEARYPPLTDSMQEELEKSTRGQGINPIWHLEKKKRITSSNFKAVVTMSVEPNKLLKRLLYETVHPTKAMKRGTEMEAIAVETYKQELEKTVGGKVAISNCGLIVSKRNPILATSPDRFVTLDDFDCGLLEVKCPSSPHALNPSNRGSCLTLSENGKATLKKNHGYYFQIQGQLALCELAWCDFFIWKSDDEYHLERISFSLDFWETNIYP